MTKGKLTIKDIMGKLGSLLALFILGVILSIATPNFLTVSNLLNILRQTEIGRAHV